MGCLSVRSKVRNGEEQSTSEENKHGMKDWRGRKVDGCLQARDQ